MGVSEVSRSEAAQAVDDLMSGDLAAISRISRYTDDDFRDVDTSQMLILSAVAVERALRSFERGEVTADQAREWAGFVQYGCIDRSRPVPADSLWIEWDPTHEDAVATAVMRLSELGDIIDGEFRPGEIDQLVAALKGPPETTA